DVVALRVVHPAHADQAHLFRALDELSDGLFAHSSRNPDDGLDDKLVHRASAESADEFAVDLEVVEGEVLEVMTGAKARSEVVQGELATAEVHPIGERPRDLQV